MNIGAFIPHAGSSEKLFYFSRNLHAHIAAAAREAARRTLVEIALGLPDETPPDLAEAGTVRVNFGIYVEDEDGEKDITA